VVVVLRLLRPVALLLVAALAVVACSSTPKVKTKTETKSTLKLYNDKGAWTPFFNDLGKLSQQQIGLGISPVGYTDANAYDATVKASFRSKTKPDLFTWHTGGTMQEIVAQNQVRDTSSIWQDAISKGYLTKDLEQYYTINGKQYCVPLNVAYWGMFYNKHVFDRYGLKPPTSWADLLNITRTLRGHGVAPIYQTSVLFSFVWFEQMVAGTDPDLYDKLNSGQVQYTDPAIVSVMKQWKDMETAGAFSDPGSKVDPAVQLKSGKTAMVPFGTWFNTSMTQQGLKPGVDYGYFVIPNTDASLPKTSLIFESGPLCAPAQPADPAADTKFLQWVLGPDAQTKWANSRGDVSANPKVTIPNQDLNTLNQQAGSGTYRLVNRYFEAAPPAVLAAGLDAFGDFTVHPNNYLKDLRTIQQANQKYWSTHKAGG